MLIPLANPKVQVDSQREEILEAIAKVFDKCQFIMGENVPVVEEKYANHCGAKYGIGVNSGTDALVIALTACGVDSGDEVITVPYTFVATTEAVLIRGAKPVFVDVDPVTFNMDTSQIESKITEKTKAILPVHLYGQCYNTEEVNRIAKKYGLKVIADSAQALGAKRNGKGIGETADVAGISFFPTKNLGCCGDGGLIITNDEKIADKAKYLRFHGMAPGSYYYNHVGYNSRLDEIQAAVLNVKFPNLDKWNTKRRENAAFYLDKFKDLPIELPIAEECNYHIYHQFTIKYNKRDELKSKLAEKGVGSAIYYPYPLHLQPAYDFLNYKENDFPITERICKQVLSLPIFPELSEEDRNTVATSVIESIQELEA
ncbi:MAG: DegT/DnrJ/EryC1/StrS family aminotransferase [Abditibacteriota bacterium]|nr:DegT/DnrJ/EryC1/StrS family aminotransferase [Abditibacteriota bacterium]